MIAIFYDFIEYLFLRTKWRRRNKHNTTVMYRRKFDINRVTVGKGTYGPITVFGEDGKSKLLIGNFCSIASDVVFITGSEHKLTNISTFPFRVKYLKETTPEAESKGNIIVDDDVWIGYSAIILSGVHIAQGAVIAAGAVVTKDVPAYAVVAGNPARLIKYRFDEKEREEALKINYDHFDEKFIKNNISILYEETNIKTIIKLINKDTTISN